MNLTPRVRVGPSRPNRKRQLFQIMSSTSWSLQLDDRYQFSARLITQILKTNLKYFRIIFSHRIVHPSLVNWHLTLNIERFVVVLFRENTIRENDVISLSLLWRATGSNSNRRLINIFDPNSSPYLIKIVATIWIRTQILNLNLNMIKNIYNLIKNLLK